MDDIIEMIIEIFCEILMDGIKFLATSSKIPKFIRTLVMIIISIVLLTVVCISTAFIFKSSEGFRVAAGIIGVLALFFLVYFQICWRKAIRIK